MIIIRVFIFLLLFVLCGISFPLFVKGQSCLPTTGINVGNVLPSQADIYWNSIPSATGYQVSYRRWGQQNWNSINNVLSPPVTLSGLRGNTSYDVRIKSICGSNRSTWSDTTSFVTGLCPNPVNVRVDSVHQNTAFICWDLIPNISVYQLRYRKLGHNGWRNIQNINNTCYVLDSLLNGQEYELQVRSVCGASTGNTNHSTWSDTLRFKTCICNSPSSVRYLDLTENTVRIEWNAESCATVYQLQYRRQNQQNWTLVNNISSNYYLLNNLRGEESYEVRVRSKCMKVLSGWSDTLFFSTPFCRKPTNTQVVQTTNTSITVTWDILTPFTEYQVRYRRVGQQNWTVVQNILSSPYTINGLLTNRNYEISVRRKCSNQNSSEWGDIVNATTINCLQPFLPSLEELDSVSYRFHWSPVSGASSYLFSYKKVEDITWQSQLVSDTSFNLINPSPCCVYEARVQSK